jgi:membrane fusion protein, multidrug efflux system
MRFCSLCKMSRMAGPFLTNPQSLRKVRLDLSLLLIIAVWSAVGCGKQAHPQSPTLPSLPEVLVTEAIQQNVPLSSECVGATQGYVDAQIRPHIQGYLQSQHYTEGAFVKAGDLLFTIDPQEYQVALDQAIGNLHQAEANLDKSQFDVTRFTPLAREGGISQQQFDYTLMVNRANQASVAVARAAVETAKLNLSRTKITSPLTGIAGSSVAQLGDLVTPNLVLTIISQVDPIKVSCPMSEQPYLRLARKLKEQQQGHASGPPLELLLADGTTYPHQGKIMLEDRQVNVQTGMILVVGVFPNPGLILRPGQYAKMRTLTDIATAAVLVPQRAVEQLPGHYRIAVVGTDNTVEIRSVNVGEQVGSQWIIQEGLKPGERVVITGLENVQAGMTVNAKLLPAEPESTIASASSRSGQ